MYLMNKYIAFMPTNYLPKIVRIECRSKTLLQLGRSAACLRFDSSEKTFSSPSNALHILRQAFVGFQVQSFAEPVTGHAYRLRVRIDDRSYFLGR